MIEVIIRHKGSEGELARIEIENVGVTPERVGDTDEIIELADYSVRFGVEKGFEVGLHQRGIFNFPRKQYNVLALLLQALNTLEPRDLEFSGPWENRQPIKKKMQLRRGFWG